MGQKDVGEPMLKRHLTVAKSRSDILHGPDFSREIPEAAQLSLDCVELFRQVGVIHAFVPNI